MVTTGITVEDIRNIAEKKLTVQLPDYKAVMSTRNLITYVRKQYLNPVGIELKTSAVDNELTIEVVDNSKQ